MASISPVTLTITPSTTPGMVNIFVSYQVHASGDDIATEQKYHEVCAIIGDDTPGDGTDDFLFNLSDGTTVFDGTSTGFQRSPEMWNVPLSALDEDNDGVVIRADEIRAKVTLTPIPASRESNLVVVGGVVVNQLASTA
jgi:hypothetical protein